MKIAYFVNHYPKVSHTFIRREIFALERQGVSIERFALHGWKDELPDVEDQREQAQTRYVLRNGVLPLLLDLLRVLVSSPVALGRAVAAAVRMYREGTSRSLIYHLVYVAEACRLLHWLRESGAEHVHAHFGTNSGEVVMLARILGGPPYSMTIHGPDEFLLPMGIVEKVRRSTFSVAISDFGRSQLFLLLPVALWPKIEVVHCGLENAFFDSALTPPPAVPRFVCVGRLTEAKGQLLLIDALAELRQRGVEAQIVLAGDGPMRAQVEERIIARGCADAVRITGWISSAVVKSELLAARAMVLPSFAEGLPVVIMEAMALGRPVLTTYIAGIPELVRPGLNGWLFPAGSVPELVAAMQACLAAPVEELARLGAAGREAAQRRHSVDTEAGKLRAFFARAGR